jgi:hypothetical protein
MRPAAGPSSLVVHASGLGLIGISLTRSFGWLGEPSRRRRESPLGIPVVIGITDLLLGVLHGLEASLWAVAYVWLGASPDFTNAVCFSLQMLTTLDVNIVVIEVRWKMMEPLKAMSGMLLFGLSIPAGRPPARVADRRQRAQVLRSRHSLSGLPATSAECVRQGISATRSAAFWYI